MIQPARPGHDRASSRVERVGPRHPGALILDTLGLLVALAAVLGLLALGG